MAARRWGVVWVGALAIVALRLAGQDVGPGHHGVLECR